MATLDDKLLGEKLHYYCSSSEDEEPVEEMEKTGGDETDKDEGRSQKTARNGSKYIPSSGNLDTPEWEGSSTNTGPKGVIRDWQRFKQLEAEKRDQQEKERLILAKKLSATCRSNLDEDKEKQQQKQLETEIVEEEDEILKEFRERRMRELMSKEVVRTKLYGKVYDMDSSEAFLTTTDKNSGVPLLIVLLYEERSPGCAAMKNCLQYLAAEYPHIMFCQIKASLVNLSSRFKNCGLPALLAYKSGELIGNYVQLLKEFGDEMYATDVESFLIEHGILEDKSLVPSAIRSRKDPV